MRGRKARVLLIGLLGTAAVVWAAQDYEVKKSTSTTHGIPAYPHGNPPHRPAHPHMQKLRKASEKVLTSNPDFQGPQSQPMPPQAPKAPQLNPEAPVVAPSGTEAFLKAAAKIMTTTWDNNIFVWLPAISTDPNTGPTIGILPVLVLSDKVSHHIRHLIAPSYTYNELFGQTVTARYYFYPSDQSQLYAIGSYSQHVNREAKVRYENVDFLDGRAFIRGEAYYDADGSLRFFGVGPNTGSGSEAGYTGRDKVLHGDMGFNFLEYLRASFGLRYRRMGIDRTVAEVKDLSDVFPTLASQPQQSTVVQEFHLLWDSRDYPVTPSRGQSGEIFFETTSQGWGSDSDFIRYGMEGKEFFPWKDGKQTTVVHGLFDKANGPNIPFYELATLGGRETLRGFGDGRFSDRGRVLFNVEHRVQLTKIEVMGVVTKFEVGPFIDAGTVFPNADGIQMKYVYPVYGAAFRAVVKPNVVGSVDVGVGREGPGVFVGINYPF